MRQISKIEEDWTVKDGKENLMCQYLDQKHQVTQYSLKSEKKKVFKKIIRIQEKASASILSKEEVRENRNPCSWVAHVDAERSHLHKNTLLIHFLISSLQCFPFNSFLFFFLDVVVVFILRLVKSPTSLTSTRTRRFAFLPKHEMKVVRWECSLEGHTHLKEKYRRIRHDSCDTTPD